MWVGTILLVLATCARAVEPVVSPVLDHVVNPTGEETTPRPFWGLSGDGGDYVTTNGLITKLSGATQGGVLCWAKISDSTVASGFWGISSEATNRTELRAFYLNGTTTIGIQCRTDATVQWNGTAPTINSVLTWHSYAVTHNGTTPIIYIDGVARTITWIAETNKTIWFSGVIGATNPATYAGLMDNMIQGAPHSVPIKGTMTQVAFYTTTPTATQITSYYAAQPRDIRTMGWSGLAAYYSMQPGSGTTLTDEMGSSPGTFGTTTAKPTWVGPYRKLTSTGPVAWLRGVFEAFAQVWGHNPFEYAG